MRVRMMDADGDMQFGTGQAAFQQNTPAAVGQLVETRLKLWLGEWFADTSDGTPWATQVLGRGTTPTYDAVIQSRILATPGVQSITSYGSSLANRALTITATVQTLYGLTTISTGS
ncbi:hypothetical protein [Brytella acorum]|uniref:Bacteriophage protein n=1 Tax=Brytella acorum TaxID=2959299 RepID=A0AA35Y262_9PROT|nr:hypothetical protein [Brytella acorum]CAI9119537.1 hypothetical protein LMG32879_000354 [Brytella acorum]